MKGRKLAWERCVPEPQFDYEAHGLLEGFDLTAELQDPRSISSSGKTLLHLRARGVIARVGGRWPDRARRVPRSRLG